MHCDCQALSPSTWSSPARDAPWAPLMHKALFPSTAYCTLLKHTASCFQKTYRLYHVVESSGTQTVLFLLTGKGYSTVWC